jgi:excisionase family DNA binding protein
VNTPKPVQRLTLTRNEAASALGVSIDSFERYIQPELRLIRAGRLRLVPVVELERWVESHASRVLEDMP